MTIRVAFIGLGTMGYPMAGHLARQGFEVTVYNRTQAVAEQWLQTYSGQYARTPAQAAAEADVILTCVGNDNDVREIYTGSNGIMQSARPGTVLVDHTTASAKLAQELAEQAASHQLAFLDAPVSGGQAGAEQGSLTVMVGGDESTLQQVRPVLECYAKAINLVGPVGYGQLCKMVNQVCIAGILQGLSEGVQLARAAGLDINTMVEVLRHGAAGSWQLVNRAETMSADQFDFGFAIDWMRKDLAICFEEAERLGIELPLAKEVDQRYQKLQERGLGRCDTSVLIKQFD